MSFAGDAAEIRTHFAAQMLAQAPTVGVAYERQRYEPTANTSWVRLTIRNAPTERLSVGTPVVYRHVGAVIVQIFTPIKTEGDGAALTLADTIAGFMRERRLTKVWLRAATITPVGDDGNFHQMNLSIPFQSTHP